jgi:anti-sigma factor RsiW
MMKYEDSHPSDEQLLLEVDGELSTHEQEALRSHLGACWRCRARRREIENAIAGFIRVQQGELSAALPPAAGPRALLKARLAELSATPPSSGWLVPARRLDWMLAAAFAGIAAISLLLAHSFLHRQNQPFRNAVVFSIPNSRLTPGAAVLASRQSVCSQANVKNKAVPAALQKRVFEEYGIREAQPQAYEVDYLVTPALGGADDVRNLWPHSYSAVWNARVKDELEDRLREMVCDGRLDLTEAQREIAENWIAAYKKYFHTEQPLDGDWKYRP